MYSDWTKLHNYNLELLIPEPENRDSQTLKIIVANAF